MKFPKVIRNKKTKVEVIIYGKKPAYPYYRVCWRVAGKRRMRSFRTYSEANKAALKLVSDLGKGSQVTALTPGQATDALAAFERLERFFQTTGRRVSLLAGISEYCESAGKLNVPLAEAVDGYLSGIATVKRKDLLQAVELFIEERKAKTKPAKEGKRPQLSQEHWYNSSLWMREFAKCFPGHAVCDLTKDHLDTYMGKHDKAAPKTRNERRGVIKMLLGWCVSKDYLGPTHRLLEARGMRHEPAEPESIDLYTADHFRSMLERASKAPPVPKDGEVYERDYRDLLPVLALAGLAGLRFKEITRLTWEDVLGRPGHIEVKAAKSKTRSRRLIIMCSSLARWLEPYRDRTGLVWRKGYDMLHEDFADLRAEVEVPDRRNGLRHSFISAHFAGYSDEGLTAAQAGTSPEMVHKHYKGLLTEEEGKAWFAVAPDEAENALPPIAATPRR